MNPIKSNPFIEKTVIQLDKFDYAVYGFQKHLLESDSRLLSLGMFPFEGEFISYKKDQLSVRMDSDKFTEVYGLMKAFIVTLETDAIREVK